MVADAIALKLASTLASKIADVAFRYWWKKTMDDPSVGRQTADLVEQANLGLAESQAKLQFAQIGSRIAQDLRPLFERPGDSEDIDESAVVDAAADALASVVFTPDLLVGVRYDAGRLTSLVLNRRPAAMALFTDNSTRLYERVVRQACHSIVYVALDLPGFEPRVVNELLNSSQLLVTQAADALVLLAQIRQAMRPPPDVARYEEDYRDAVQRNLDRLALIGIGRARESNVRTQNVTAAYLTLRVASDDQPIGDGVNVAAARAAPGSAPPIDQILARSSRLLMRGLAGSGKTTVLQWLGVRAAAQDFVGPLAPWNPRVPFFIRLSEHVSGRLPSPETWPGLVAASLARKPPIGWVADCLRDRGLVLVDGLDELAGLRRRLVIEWLTDIIGTYKQAIFIISSRPDPESESWLHSLGFQRADLLPLDAVSVPLFVDHWHNALRESPGITTAEVEELPALATRLKARLEQEGSLLSIATTPLLCSLLCTLNRDRNTVPDDRIELYRQCCELLAYRRDYERFPALESQQGGVRSDYTGLSYQQILLFLQDLALQLLTNGQSEVSNAGAERQFERTLQTIGAAPPEATGTNIRKLLVERSGLLRQVNTRMLGFVHPAFLEFMAAQAVLEQDRIGQVLLQVSRPDDDLRWRAVAVLAAGLGNKRERSDLIRGLLVAGDGDATLRLRLYILAAACLAEVPRLDLELKEELESRLARLIPPADEDAVAVLAETGDLVVPLLREPPAEEAGALACIQTLALIQTSASRAALRKYSEDTRGPVKEAAILALAGAANKGNARDAC